jgi:hypothetical protein
VVELRRSVDFKRFNDLDRPQMVDTLKVWAFTRWCCVGAIISSSAMAVETRIARLKVWGEQCAKFASIWVSRLNSMKLTFFRVRLRPKTNASLKSWACPSRRKKAATARSAEFAIRSLKLCTVWHVQGKIDCGGDFRCLINSILEHHLETEPQYWLASLLEPTPNFSRSFSTV